jgi:hypothetical protein
MLRSPVYIVDRNEASIEKRVPSAETRPAGTPAESHIRGAGPLKTGFPPAARATMPPSSSWIVSPLDESPNRSRASAGLAAALADRTITNSANPSTPASTTTSTSGRTLG